MTTNTEKPCLPGCRIVAAGFLGEQFVHDMACERHSINILRKQNAPKAEAPEPVKHHPDFDFALREFKPAPEPPKQEQGEPIDWKAAAQLANAWYYANRFEVFGPGRRELARAYLALKSKLATVEANEKFWHDTADDRSRHILTVEAERDAALKWASELERAIEADPCREKDARDCDRYCTDPEIHDAQRAIKRRKESGK